MPCLYVLYPGILLTTEEKAWKNLSQGYVDVVTFHRQPQQVCSFRSPLDCSGDLGQPLYSISAKLPNYGVPHTSFELNLLVKVLM